MPFIAIVFMILGFILMVAGIVLFATRGPEGTSTIKGLGFEFQLGGSSLVIVVLGFFLLILPIAWKKEFQEGDFAQRQPEEVKQSPNVPTADPTPKPLEDALKPPDTPPFKSPLERPWLSGRFTQPAAPLSNRAVFTESFRLLRGETAEIHGVKIRLDSVVGGWSDLEKTANITLEAAGRRDHKLFLAANQEAAFEKAGCDYLTITVNSIQRAEDKALSSVTGTVTGKCEE